MSALTYHRMLAQIPLDNAAERIRLAVALPGSGHDGLVQMRVDADHSLLTVYWHGPVPTDIAALFRSLERTVRIRVQAARYSRTQLARAVSMVMRGGYPVTVTEANPRTDGNGIEVTVAGPLPAAIRPATAASAGRSLFSLAMPVTLTLAGAQKVDSCYVPSDTLGTPARCNDFASYWGGAVLVNANHGNGCTSGFGATSTVDGKQYLVTASHCGQQGDTFLNGQGALLNGGQGARPLSTMYLLNRSHDDAVILVSSAGGSYYDGPGILSGDTHTSKPVVGAQGSAVGDWLCESGAFGGVMCGMQVEKLNAVVQEKYSVDGGPVTTYNVVNEAITTPGTNGYPTGGGAAIPGDSGGPVFSLSGSGVIAKGIILGDILDSNNNPTGENGYMTIDWVSSDFKIRINNGP